MDFHYVYKHYAYYTLWKAASKEIPLSTLLHIIATPDNKELAVNFDPNRVMTERDFRRMVDYYEAKGDFPVNLIPDEPIRNGQPTLFCAISGIN